MTSSYTLIEPTPAQVSSTGAEALLRRPEALLLDFGGVVFQTRKRVEAWTEIAEHVAAVLARAGHRVPAEQLLPILRGGERALKDWKNAQSRRLEPTEMGHRELWRDFYGSPLPPAAREVLVGSAGWLQEYVVSHLSEHTVRPGIPGLLDLATRQGVRLGIVSNAHSGRAHRALLEKHGLARYFGVQVYSDEVGIRKPHPGMIHLAAEALGTTAERSWYVGDTLDRDVIAGRRAGVAAVILTRHHHTDTPPFPVTEKGDALYETPEGLVTALADSRPANGAAGPRPAPADAVPLPRADPRLPSAVLLDHGGVIAVSTPDDTVQRQFAARLAVLLSKAGWTTTTDQAEQLIAEARGRHKAWKAAGEQALGTVPEVDATTFWVGFAGPSLVERLGDPDVLAWLRAEAHMLMTGFARAKSTPAVRDGLRDLLVALREAGVPVAVVSNTVSGRAVREELVAEGLDEFIGAHVYSDELGRRKPDPLMPATALAALAADPARAVFVGDKPQRDVAAARAAGIGTVVLLRGGSTSDADLEAAQAGPNAPDHLLDSPADLTALLLDPR